MALIKCRECGKEISGEASCCVHCGCPSEPLGDIDVRCIKCGTYLRENHCPNCGYSAVASKKERKKITAVLLGVVAVCLILIIVLACLPKG